MKTIYPEPTMQPSPSLIRAHTVAACLSAGLATGPTSVAEMAIIPALLVFLATAHKTCFIWKRAFVDPMCLALLLFSAWVALGIAWSPGVMADSERGLDEFGVLRFFPVVLLVMPALHLSKTGRVRVVAALGVGLAIGELVQLLHAWAVLGHGPAVFDFGRARHRISGYWDPAVAGTILTAGLGLHLPVALMGWGRPRRVALAASAATVAALLATGSRGGWVASGFLIVIASLVALVGAVRKGERTGRTLAGLAVLALVIVAGGVVFRGTITERVDKARSDFAEAARGDYSNADAARLAMAMAAVDAFRAHPVRGVGTGNYGPWARAHAQARGEEDERHPGTVARASSIHDHAHNTVLHVAATHGVVGLGLLLAVGLTAMRGAIVWVRCVPACGAGMSVLGTYRAGPLFALIGLFLMTPFDTLHVSASSAAVSGVVLALCACPPRRCEV